MCLAVESGHYLYYTWTNTIQEGMGASFLIHHLFDTLTIPKLMRKPKRTIATVLIRPSPLEIPEILEHIFSYLDRETILQGTRRVCRRWYHVGNRFYSLPLVYSVPFVLQREFFKAMKQLMFARGFYLTTFLDYEIDEQWPAVRDAPERKNNGISPTTFRSDPLSPLQPTPLREFHHTGTIEWSKLAIILPHFGSLISLRLKGSNRYSGVRVDDLLLSCPALEDLHLMRQNLHGKQHGSDFLSSLDIDNGAQTPLVPTPASAVNSLGSSL